MYGMKWPKLKQVAKQTYKNKNMEWKGILQERTFTHRCISTAKAAQTALCTSVESKEGKHMDTKAITNSSIILTVHLKEQHIRVHLSKLTQLP